MNLVLTSVKEIIKEVKIGCSLGYSNHTMVECDLEEHRSGKEWSLDLELQESVLQVV